MDSSRSTRNLVVAFSILIVVLGLSLSIGSVIAQSGSPSLRDILRDFSTKGEDQDSDVNNDGVVNAFDYAIRLSETYDELCGNSEKDLLEKCDDGNNQDGDGCSATCDLECGNGVVDLQEECDDGNLNDDDGCSSKCIAENGIKKSSRYEDRTVFLVSDQSWQDVVSLVPVATWDNQDGSSDSHPFLVYHKESSTVYDAESIIQFLRDYNPSRVYIMGSLPTELAGLLVTFTSAGAKLKADELTYITQSDFPGYWDNYAAVVVSEADYSTAMLASSYASLRNYPLVVDGTSLDTAGTYSGKRVICIGNATPSGAQCHRTPNLDDLAQEYFETTSSDKFVLTNPADLSISKAGSLRPYGHGNSITKLYTKTSLTAPYIAASKNQILLFTKGSTYQDIDANFEEAIEGYYPDEYSGKYLTVVGAPNSIPYREQMDNIGSWPNHRALDQNEYANFDYSDYYPEMYAGRIYGISVSDASSLYARSMFYDDLTHPLGVMFTASSFQYMVNDAIEWTAEFKEAGYDALSDTAYPGGKHFSPTTWDNKQFVSYMDHGSATYSGIYYSEIPDLENAFVFSDSCSTCSTFDANSFCSRSVRQGAVMYTGATSIGWTGSQIYMNTMNGIYYSDRTVGRAFNERYSTTSIYRWMITLLGDPTLNPNTQYLLNDQLMYY
jgi:cysteine-rich repeat protein